MTALTFGIELEFLLIVKFEDHVLLGPPGRRLEAILSQPIYDQCSIPGCQTKHEHKLNVVFDAHPATFEAWTITTDMSISLSLGELATIPRIRPIFDWYGGEVRSPAFHYHVEPPTASPEEHIPWYSPSWEIDHILQLLKTVNNPEKPNGCLRIFTNKSSGLHVHVGSGIPSLGFELQTIKNVLGFGTVFERQLDSVHDTTRIGISKKALRNMTSESPEFGGTVNDWLKPLSKYHIRNTDRSIRMDKGECVDEVHRFPMREYASQPWLHSSGTTMSAIAWHRVVHRAESIQDLLQLFTVFIAKYSTISIDNLNDDQGEYPALKGTFEFRQHAGTLDHTEVMAWIHTVVRLVEWCNDVGKEEYSELIKNYWADPNLRLFDLLEHIEVPDSAIAHYHRLFDLSSGEYAEERHERAMQIEHQHEPGNALTPLIEYVEDERRRCRSVDAVRNVIYSKFLTAGYGKYPQSTVEGLGEQAQNLIIDLESEEPECST